MSLSMYAKMCTCCVGKHFWQNFPNYLQYYIDTHIQVPYTGTSNIIPSQIGIKTEVRRQSITC